MARYKATIAYDGTQFSGFQRQTRDRTVQGDIEEGLKALGWDGESILAAGRTDAGVHAAGQVIAFDLEWKHPASDLQNALNATLPEDIAVQVLELATEDFHPRYDALSRRYRYRLICQAQRDPLRERYAWRVWPALEFERMVQASQRLLGEYDFAAFGTAPWEGGTTVRQLYAAEWKRQEDEYSFDVTANAFLFHMVRRMVKLLVEIGHGNCQPEIVSQYLSAERPGMPQGLAPPQGLSLMEVRYEA
jgi:tRNA pseudouridine38-40 synthase